MISFIKGLYFDLDCRVQRVLAQLKADNFHPDIQKSFVPKTIENPLQTPSNQLKTLQITGVAINIAKLAINHTNYGTTNHI